METIGNTGGNSAASPQERRWSDVGLHVLAKPIGPICNLDCSYCFYLQKEHLYPQHEQLADVGCDPGSVHPAIHRSPAEARRGGQFCVPGGRADPDGVGLLPPRRRAAAKVRPARQTDQQRGADQRRGVGRRLVRISQDPRFSRGPVDRWARGSSRCLSTRQTGRSHVRAGHARSGVPPQTWCGVQYADLRAAENADHPARVYGFLRDRGVEFMQFIPIVERLPGVALQGDPGDAPPGVW